MSRILVKVMAEVGLTQVNPNDIHWWQREDGYEVFFDDLDLEIFDRMYCEGHRDGWERGAYEEQQQEDVGPDVLEKLD